MLKKFINLNILFILGGYCLLNAQSTRSITTAVPFLQVSADARAAGVGDQGVATSPDVFSQQWNSSKYAFLEDELGIGVNVTPYLTKLVNDIVLANLTGYKQLENGRSAVAVGFRYFSLGEIDFTDSEGVQYATEKPNELALDLSYSMKLSDYYSMSVAGRYLRSDLRLNAQNSAEASTDASPGNSFGVDITGYYQSREMALGDIDGIIRAGFSISNIGPKMSYSEGTESFIPTNLRIGGGMDFVIDAFNVVKGTVEFSKLLVPSTQIDGSNLNESAFSGIFTSFGDNPDGFSGEIKEFTMAIGAEYVYNEAFALRLGYFGENEDYGARNFISFGAGFKYTTIGIDMSYLFSTSSVPSPLEGTLRFGLTFGMGN